MKTLNDLLYNLETQAINGATDTPVPHLHFDSRQVNPGDTFVAIRGNTADGHEFIPQVINQGAAVIVAETPPHTNADVVWVQVANTRQALGKMAAHFYDHPAKKLQLVGVTGTNGKTTIATLLHTLFQELGYTAGLLSTIAVYVGNTEYQARLTTPDLLTINRYLHEMVQAGCTHCFMEVSSHAVVQYRIAGLHFTGGIFTNITHDHLDYHGSFKNYLQAKKSFFDQLPPSAFALTNADDKNGRVMLQNTAAKKQLYGLHGMADFKAHIREWHPDGMLLAVHQQEVMTRFLGTFNAYNLLAVYATAVLLGLDSQQVLIAISQLQPVNGRFETLRSPEGVTAIVDYAHTPDALDNVLATIHQMRTGNETLISLVGAGGDRDAAKRPKMAAIAAKYADKVILTSDNPRTEDPMAIIQDMQAGLDMQQLSHTLTIADRREAIKTACMMARPGDIILVPGKGHETYQEIHGVRHHFDDKEEINKYFHAHD